MRKSPGSPPGNWDWCEVFELLANVYVDNYGASNVRSDDPVLGIPSLSIVTVSAVAESIRYEPSSRSSNLEYKLVTIGTAAVTANGGWPTYTHCSGCNLSVTHTRRS